MSKLKAFADDKRNVTQKAKYDLENIEGKGENAGYRHFFPFLTMLSKGFFFRLVKGEGCVVKSYPFPNKPWFLRVCSRSVLKTLWEEEKLLVTSNFSFSHSVFYPFGELCAIFVKLKIVVCKLFQFGIV